MSEKLSTVCVPQLSKGEIVLFAYVSYVMDSVYVTLISTSKSFSYRSLFRSERFDNVMMYVLEWMTEDKFQLKQTQCMVTQADKIFMSLRFNLKYENVIIYIVESKAPVAQSVSTQYLCIVESFTE